MLKFTVILTAILTYLLPLYAQDILRPADNVFEKKEPFFGKSEMTYYSITGGNKVVVGTYSFNVSTNGKTNTICTRLDIVNSSDFYADTIISDAITFKPSYRSSMNRNYTYLINYSNGATGSYFDKQTSKKIAIKESLNEAFFDNFSYPFFLGMLPLTTGYKKDLAVYDFKPTNKTNISKSNIDMVRSNIYNSKLTGNHAVWQVEVYEEATDNIYEYYIDKKTSKIWQIKIKTKNQSLLIVDNEIEFNPFVNTFNYEETIKLVNKGTSVIKGQAFARDNKNGGALQGMAILNVNKKQFAYMGTEIILIPYTKFFKEWLATNDTRQKKYMEQIALPKGAEECIKRTEVYDDKGNFEFVNLMAGEYLLATKFTYEHSATQTDVVGRSDTYVNGVYQGSNNITNSYNFIADARANIKKIVTVKNDGDKVTVKFKKTLL